MLWPFHCPKSAETLNLLPTSKATLGSIEILTDLPTDLKSLPSLAAWSWVLDAGDCGIWEEVRKYWRGPWAVSLGPWVWYIVHLSHRQAWLWHSGRWSVYVTREAEDSTQHQSLPVLRTRQRETNIPKGDSDPPEIHANTRWICLQVGKPLLMGQQGSRTLHPTLYYRSTIKMERNSQRPTCPAPLLHLVMLLSTYTQTFWPHRVGTGQTQV